jgi:hypothetical protein
MSFGLFKYTPAIDEILKSTVGSKHKLLQLEEVLGEEALPNYLQRFIERTSIQQPGALFVHAPLDVSGYSDSGVEKINRRKGFIGTNQLAKAPVGTVHHLFVAHHKNGNARVIYKFSGNIQFIKNTAHDS